MKTILLSLFMLLDVCTHQAVAGQVRVPQDQPTIAGALAVVQEGDTVSLAPGNYMEFDLVAEHGITLLGNPADPGEVVIDAWELGRILLLEAWANYRIEGITFQAGRAPEGDESGGGAILAPQPVGVRIQDCRFSDCFADNGGAVALLGGLARIQDCTFERNHGSALYSTIGALELFDCTFVGNNGWNGGGLNQASGQVLIDGCLFTNNIAGYSGGGADIASGFVYNTVFSGNRAEYGGAMDVSRLTASRVTIHDSHAPQGSCIQVSYECDLRDSILGHGSGNNMVRKVVNQDFQQIILDCCCIDFPIGITWTNDDSQDVNPTLVFADPLHCDPRNGDFHLAADSPCLPEGNDCGVRMGAFPWLGCELPSVVAGFQPEHSWAVSGVGLQFLNLSSPWSDRWSWDFDSDGVIDSEERDPVWVYEGSGPRTVTLVAGSPYDSDTLRMVECVDVHMPRTWLVPEEWADIQSALEGCEHGDIVSVACGHYTVQGLSLPETVTLTSRTGDPECVILDGGGSGRVFDLALVDSSTRITGLTITGGSATAAGIGGVGGGMRIIDASPVIRNCILKGNTATIGGAISISGESSPRFESCTFALNLAASLASAVYTSGSRGTFHDCILSGNGPAIAVQGSPGFFCSDIHGNPGGDWTPAIVDQLGQSGNFSLDPLFCDTEDGLYRLEPDSPCRSGECGLLGANAHACSDTDLEPPGIPETTDLLECYPNPFNARLVIRCNPSDPGPWRIRLVDLLGRTVREWQGRSVDGSTRLLAFEGANLSSGMYLVQLDSGTAHVVRKVILAK